MSKLNLISSSYRLLNQQCLTRRYLRSLGKQTANYCQLVKKSPNEFEVQESEDLNFNFQEMDIPKDLKMDKLVNLNLKAQIDKISKPGSFVAELFLGKIDCDFLYYPKLVNARKDYLRLAIQNAMIRRNFRDTICKPDSNELLRKYGFFNLWNMSMTEKCSIFESIGASMADGLLYKKLKNPTDDLDHSDIMKIYDPDYKNQFVRLLLETLSGSCFTFAGLDKEICLKYRQLIEEGAKIGFAFNETEPKLGSLPFSDWTTVAKLSPDKTHWILNGLKNKLLNDDYDHYIVFAKTNDYPEDEKAKYVRKYEEPYDGVVCLLVDKKDIKVSEDESNSSEGEEFSYQQIEIDNLKVPRDSELFEAEEYGCFALSCRGMGILMNTSYVVGFLKSIQRQAYGFLIEKKSEFLDCKAVQNQLTNLTEINYTIESMVYLVAAMYDQFELNTFPDMTLETSILKSFTAEQSRQFLVKIQLLLGSKLMDVSKLHNVINLYDSLFDSGLHHRLFTASMGAHFVGVYNVNDVIKYNLPYVFPSYTLWKKWKMRKNELDSPILEHDVAGSLHVKLVEEGDKLEYCLKRLEYGAFLALDKYKNDLNEEQMVLSLLSEAVTHVFVLTCALSRASRSEIEGVWNSEYEVYMARSITKQRVDQIRLIIDKLQNHLILRYDETLYDEQIHKKNLKFNGYFAYSPIEPTY